jgi:hypothetical protein
VRAPPRPDASLGRHLSQGYTRQRSGRIGLRIGQFRTGFINRHLVVARIELDEHGAGFDELVLLHSDLHHRPADASRDLRDVPVNLRIVG